MDIALNNNLPETASDGRFLDMIGTSQLGTPIFDDLFFPGGKFLSLEGVEIEYQPFTMESVRFVINQAKNIVRTAVSGRNGLVKEYNFTGDYIIRGQVALAENIPVFPADQLQAFVELAEVPEAVPVVSKILNTMFKIDQVVISEFRVDPGNAVGTVFVDFALESDTDFDLADFIIVEK